MDYDQSKFRVINFVSLESLAGLKGFLDCNGFCVFELDGEEITDAQSFSAQSVKVLPQDPPLSDSVHWDAFTDSLFGGLDKLGEKRVAIVWTHVERMLEGGLEDLFIAAQCFQDLASNVATGEYGISQPVELLVFLVGHGDNFKSFGQSAI